MSSRYLTVVAPDAGAGGAEQLSLAFGQENALWIAHLAILATSEFLGGLRRARPRFVVDLRPVPDFLKPGLNRGRLFRELDSLRAVYRDLGGIISSQGLANPHILAEQLGVIFKACGPPFGPIVLLIDQTRAATKATMMLHQVLKPTSHGSWRMRMLGKPPLRVMASV